MFLMLCFYFYNQKTAYEMRISDWSSDVCSSDLHELEDGPRRALLRRLNQKESGTRVKLTRRVRWSGLNSLACSRTVRKSWLLCAFGEIGRASCRERVGKYV